MLVAAVAGDCPPSTAANWASSGPWGLAVRHLVVEPAAERRLPQPLHSASSSSDSLHSLAL